MNKCNITSIIQVLVMHGGLFSRDDVTLADIRATERNRQPPEEGIMCELLWSDPQPMYGRSPSKRGVGCQFGPDVTRRFLENNGLEYIIRSHEVKVGETHLVILVVLNLFLGQWVRGDP